MQTHQKDKNSQRKTQQKNLHAVSKWHLASEQGFDAPLIPCPQTMTLFQNIQPIFLLPSQLPDRFTAFILWVYAKSR